MYSNGIESPKWRPDPKDESNGPMSMVCNNFLDILSEVNQRIHRTEREPNTTAPPKVTEGQGVTTDLEWDDNYGPLDPQTERGSDTTAPPKVAEGQGVTTDWEWVASTSPLNEIPIGLI